jgi:TPR repeat protein
MAMAFSLPLVAQEDLQSLILKAEQGDYFAQYSLGFNYSNGEGVPENGAEAVKWYRLAAEQGHATAQNNLGAMYALGEGVPQNYTKAYVWSSVAVAQGTLAVVRDIAAAKLTPQDLSKAQAIASRCFESKFKDCD